MARPAGNILAAQIGTLSVELANALARAETAEAILGEQRKQIETLTKELALYKTPEKQES